MRTLERLVAAFAFICLTPMLLPVLLVVRFKSRLPPIIAHKRVGFGGRDLWIFKVRTMWPALAPQCSSNWIEYLSSSEVPRSKAVRDPRITSRFAQLLRRYSIDEWPQLWQVAVGQLDFVGPRALTEAELNCYCVESISMLLSTKPGLMGLCQVRGRDRLSYKQRTRLDRFMLENWSFRLYCYIVAASIPVVLSGRNAS